jgi:hypothetical protein
MDIDNTALERARTPTDLTNQFKTNYSYDLPFGGSHAMHFDNRVLDRFIQGWVTSANLSWVSGNPYSVESGYGTFLRQDFSADNTANALLTRPQLDNFLTFQMTGNGPYMVASSAIGADGRGVAPAGSAPFAGQLFTNPVAGAIGALQRRQFDGPNVFNMDAALFKETRINERVGVELRMEALNVFNHATFAVFDSTNGNPNPNMNINSQLFGVITSQATSPRQLQFGLRVKF